MAVTVVVGGQFGSEGKGKVAYLLARESEAAIAVRVGGPNSGHTAVVAGEKFVLRQLPTPALVPGVIAALAPGCYIEPSVLLSEIGRLGVLPNQLAIDPRAAIVSKDAKDSEACAGLNALIGSTESGTGAAVMRRIARDGRILLARDVPELSPYLRDTSTLLRDALNRGRRVIIEGTQGYGLSLLHSSDYPFATSRDTTAAAAVSEAGVSPRDVDEIVLVLRAFPIRVAGNSGPLPREIDWAAVTTRGGHDHSLLETTSVTGRTRRVGEFDPVVANGAIATNQPTCIVMNHLDYVDHQVCVSQDLTGRAAMCIAQVERQIGRRVDRIGLGPTDLLELTSEARRLVV